MRFVIVKLKEGLQGLVAGRRCRAHREIACCCSIRITRVKEKKPLAFSQELLRIEEASPVTGRRRLVLQNPYRGA